MRLKNFSSRTIEWKWDWYSSKKSRRLKLILNHFFPSWFQILYSCLDGILSYVDNFIDPWLTDIHTCILQSKICFASFLVIKFSHKLLLASFFMLSLFIFLQKLFYSSNFFSFLISKFSFSIWKISIFYYYFPPFNICLMFLYFLSILLTLSFMVTILTSTFNCFLSNTPFTDGR